MTLNVKITVVNGKKCTLISRADVEGLSRLRNTAAEGDFEDEWARATVQDAARISIRLRMILSGIPCK